MKNYQKAVAIMMAFITILALLPVTAFASYKVEPLKYNHWYSLREDVRTVYKVNFTTDTIMTVNWKNNRGESYVTVYPDKECEESRIYRFLDSDYRMSAGTNGVVLYRGTYYIFMRDDDNKAKVKGINFGGTKNVAKVCSELNIPMMYISTDYVFDGQGTKPWKPDCTDYKPLNYYGETKLMGERAVTGNLEKYFIVRIAWVFGVNGKNFIKTMLNVGKNHTDIKVVNDQIGTPTYTYDLARLLVDMIQTDKYGYYHATNEGGYISWYDFTKEIYRQAVELGHNEYSEDRITVNPVTTDEYGLSKAARPFNSRLDKSKLVECGFEPLPTWQDAINKYLKEITY